MWYLFSKSVTIYHLPVYQTWPSELSLYGLNSRAAHPYPTPSPTVPIVTTITVQWHARNNKIVHSTISHPHAPTKGRPGYLILRASHPSPCHLLDHCRGRSKMSHRHVMPLGDPESPRKVPMERLLTFLLSVGNSDHWSEDDDWRPICHPFEPKKSSMFSVQVVTELTSMLIGQVGVKMFSVYEDVFSFCFGATSRVWGTHPIRLLGTFLSHAFHGSGS